MVTVFSSLMEKQKLDETLRSDIFQLFIKSDLSFRKTLLSTSKPIRDQMTIEYSEEDYRVLEKIGKWEAKIKEGIDVNEALKKEIPLQEELNEEVTQEKELQAKAFVEKMQRETNERHIRFKLEAERRLKEIVEEEKNKEKQQQRDLLANVKKRQRETLIKLQAVKNS